MYEYTENCFCRKNTFSVLTKVNGPTESIAIRYDIS